MVADIPSERSETTDGGNHVCQQRIGSINLLDLFRQSQAAVKSPRAGESHLAQPTASSIKFNKNSIYSSFASEVGVAEHNQLTDGYDQRVTSDKKSEVTPQASARQLAYARLSTRLEFSDADTLSAGINSDSAQDQSDSEDKDAGTIKEERRRMQKEENGVGDGFTQADTDNEWAPAQILKYHPQSVTYMSRDNQAFNTEAVVGNLINKIRGLEGDDRGVEDLSLIGAEVVLLAFVMSAASIRKRSPEDLAQELLVNEPEKKSSESKAVLASFNEIFAVLKQHVDKPWFNKLVDDVLAVGTVDKMLGLKGSPAESDESFAVGINAENWLKVDTKNEIESKMPHLVKTAAGNAASGEKSDRRMGGSPVEPVNAQKPIAGPDSIEDPKHEGRPGADHIFNSEDVDRRTNSEWPGDTKPVECPALKESQDKDEATILQSALKRPTWLVRPSEDLVNLAEHLFQDRNIGWLIAAINAKCTDQYELDGKRVIEMHSRQRIEIPVWQDIVQFRRTAAYKRDHCELLSIVKTTAVNRELMQESLGLAMGVIKDNTGPAATKSQ